MFHRWAEGRNTAATLPTAGAPVVFGGQLQFRGFSAADKSSETVVQRIFRMNTGRPRLIAPQAPLEESATTEASRRCSLNGMLTGIRRPFWGRGFESSASGICVLTVQNMVPELLQIGSILSVCVSVCLFVQLFAGPLLDRFWTEFICNFRKKIT